MKRFKRTIYFYKSLLSYLIIFIIPILIFAGIFQFRYKEIIQDELIKNNQNQVNSLKVNIESEITQIQKIMQQFIVLDDTTPFDLENDPLRAFAMRDKLKQYNSTNPFIYDIIYYFHGHKYIYTSASSHQVSNFIDEIYNYDQWEYDAFISDSESITSRIIRPKDTIFEYDHSAADYTTFLYPISKDGVSYFGTLLFLVPETALKNKIKQVYADDLVTTILLDEKKQLITATNFNEDVNLENFSDLSNQLPSSESSIIITLDDSDYLMSSSTGEVSGWQYLTFVSIDSALYLAFELQKQFIIVLILILIIGAVLISLLMAMNYSPIRNLQKLSELVLKSSDKTKSSNEIDSIKGAINYLAEQNIELSETVDDNKLAAKDYVVGQLLSGQDLKKDRLDSDVIKQLMNPNYNHFFTFITHISHEENFWSDLKLELIMDIEAYSNENYYFICKESIEKNNIIVVTLHNDQADELVYQQLDAIRLQLMDKWKIGMTIGVGKTFELLEDLPKSFMGASTAIDYRHMVGNNNLIYYKQIVENTKEIRDYPYTELKLFKNAIKKGNVNDVDTILNTIVTQFTQNTMPLFIARSICFDIITSVVDNAKKSGADHQEIFYKYPDIFSITKYESIYKIIEIVKLVSYDVCKSLNATYDRDYKILITNMTKYIEDNYMSPDFTLQYMADHYNMQKTNLSSFYKEHSNVNIFEFVTELRMNAAEELLKNTKLPVKRICNQVGYDNVSSFIRRFKQIYNVTPGNYRILANDSKDSSQDLKSDT